MRSSRPAAVALLLVALVAVLSHVCSLPGHSHIGAHHEDGDHTAADQSHSDDGIHAASCEAVRVPTSGLTPPAVVCGVDSLVVVAAVAMEPLPRAPRAAASPPLFLLHGALLI